MLRKSVQLKLIPSLLVLTLTTMMVALGFWQLDRGHEKQHLINLQIKQRAQPAISIIKVLPHVAANVYAEGAYSKVSGVLLDNQSHHQTPGIAAWNIFTLNDGSEIIVNRGWIALLNGAIPLVPAPPLHPQKIFGFWHALPSAGMRLSTQISLCDENAPKKSLVNYPSIAELRCKYGNKLRNGILDLSPEMPYGFTRDSNSSGLQNIPPSRHYAYAVQWWLFALTLVILFLKISYKPTHS